TGECLRLVEDDPLGDAITERVSHDANVFCETGGGVSGGPAAGILERLRQIPVGERRQRPYTGFGYRVRQTLVVVEAVEIGSAATQGLNTGPGDREAVALQIELLEQCNVIRIPVITVAGDIARIAILDIAGLVSEAIPD